MVKWISRLSIDRVVIIVKLVWKLFSLHPTIIALLETITS